MDINTQNINPQQTTPATTPYNQQVVKEEKDEKSPGTEQSPDLTVNISNEATKLATAPESNKSTKIEDEKQAKAALEEFKTAAANDPVAVNNAIGEPSAEEVARLIA